MTDEKPILKIWPELKKEIIKKHNTPDFEESTYGDTIFQCPVCLYSGLIKQEYIEEGIFFDRCEFHIEVVNFNFFPFEEILKEK